MQINLLIRLGLFAAIVAFGASYAPDSADQAAQKHKPAMAAWDFNEIDHTGNIYRVDYALSGKDCFQKMFAHGNDGFAHECVRHADLDLD